MQGKSINPCSTPLHTQPWPLIAVDPILDLRDQFQDLAILAQSFHQIGRVGIELLAPNHRLADALQAPDIFQDLLDQRPQHRQESVGFVDREESRKIGVHVWLLETLAGLGALITPRRRLQLHAFADFRSSAMLSEWPVMRARIAPRIGRPSK